MPSKGFVGHKVPTTGPLAVRRLFHMLNIHRMRVEELAEKTGIGWQTIYGWRAGRSKPPHESLEKCFNALGRTLIDMRIEDVVSVHKGQGWEQLMRGQKS